MRFLILYIGIIFLGIYSSPLFSQSNSDKNNINADQVHSAFDRQSNEWNISWPGRVSRYDLVYKSPPIDPMQGIPLGNGEIGALFWCEDSKLIIALNKSDLWDDAEPDGNDKWKNETDDRYTTLRHASRIVIDFKMPVFSSMYLTDFDARLSIADASLSIRATSPYGKVGIRAFVDHKTGALIYDLNSDLNEDVPTEVTVERYGSRTFSSWYSRINRDATIGLSGTDAKVEDKGLYITQELAEGVFAVGGAVVKSNGLDVNYSRDHSRSATISLSGKREKTAQLAFSVSSPTVGNPISVVKAELDTIITSGIDTVFNSHSQIWKSIWNRSLMDYGDDYLNNLWYLTMYYANASQGGKYPGRFTNGLWGWSRDVQNWNFYFHWNQQQLYWPLNAAGHHDLLDPYLDFRFNSLPHAKRDAEEVLNLKGAFISDVTNRKGYNHTRLSENHTPVAEIALDFWRQYQFTGDEKFLKEKALPFILEAARFFESLLTKEEDGLYHSEESTGYEGWIKLKDGLTDLVYARAILNTALEALKIAKVNIEEADNWKYILENMAPLPLVKTSKGLIDEHQTEYEIIYGKFKGSLVHTDSVVAAGWGIEENQMLPTYFEKGDVNYAAFGEDYPAYSPNSVRNGLKLLDGIFPTLPSSPVFPSGLIGLSDRDNVLFDNMVATTLLYGTECTGWDPASIVMARLGLSDALEKDLTDFPGRWQIYDNGWGHWGMENEINKDAEMFFRTNTVSVNSSKTGERIPLRMWPFRHTSLESLSVLATAMNESLVQGHEGVIRVFPAFPDNRNGRFTLHAQGGFVVSSEIESGKVLWVSIKSLLGNNLRLQLPWEEADMQRNNGGGIRHLKGEEVEIKTKVNEVMTIVPRGSSFENWKLENEDPKPNDRVKYHSSGKTRLGIPRMF